MQKSIFASEAGLGTGAIASGATSSNNYVKQGYIGVISTYFINIVITTITGLIIILSNYKSVSFGNINGIEITNYAFNYHLGHFGEVMLLILILLFAFSTIITANFFLILNWLCWVYILFCVLLRNLLQILRLYSFNWRV